MTPTSLEATGRFGAHGNESSEVRRRFQQSRSQRPTPIVEINLNDTTGAVEKSRSGHQIADEVEKISAKHPWIPSNAAEEFDLTPLLLNSYIPAADAGREPAQADAASMLHALRELGIIINNSIYTAPGSPARRSDSDEGRQSSREDGVEMQDVSVQRRNARDPNRVRRQYLSVLPGFGARTVGDEDEELALLRGNGDRVRLIALETPDHELSLAVQRAPGVLSASASGPASFQALGSVTGVHFGHLFSDYVRPVLRFLTTRRSRTAVVPTG